MPREPGFTVSQMGLNVFMLWAYQCYLTTAKVELALPTWSFCWAAIWLSLFTAARSPNTTQPIKRKNPNNYLPENATLPNLQQRRRR